MIKFRMLMSIGKTFFIPLSMLALVSCGGGDGSTNTTQTSNPTPTPTPTSTPTPTPIANAAPVFDSESEIEIDENLEFSMFVNATDANGDDIVYRVVGGDDQGIFSFDANSARLIANTRFDFEAPLDQNGDNIYQMIIEADDQQGALTQQTINVSVRNVNIFRPEMVFPSDRGNLGGRAIETRVAGLLFDDEDNIVGTDHGVTVSVNGINAQFSQEQDNYWFVDVPVSQGVNAIAIDVVNNASEVIASESYSLNNLPYLVSPSSLAWDTSNNIAYLIDAAQNSIFSLNMTSGELLAISEDDSGLSTISSISKMQFDSQNQRLFALSQDNDRLVSFDIATGVPTVISDGTTGSGTAFSDPVDITLDIENERVLVVDTGRIISVDLANNARTVVVDPAVALPENPSVNFVSIDLVSPTVAWLVDPEGNLYEADLSLQSMNLLGSISPGLGYDDFYNSYIEIDPSNDRIIFNINTQLYSADINTFVVNSILPIEIQRDLDLFNLSGLVWNSSSNQLAVLDSSLKAIVLAELQTEVQEASVIYANTSAAGQGDRLRSLSTLGFDEEQDVLFGLTRSDLNVVSIDLDGGVRRQISDRPLPANVDVRIPTSLTIDSESCDAYLITLLHSINDPNNAVIYSYDLENGTIAPSYFNVEAFTDLGFEDQGISFFVSPSLVLDNERDRLLFSWEARATGQNSGEAGIASIDLETMDAQREITLPYTLANPMASQEGLMSLNFDGMDVENQRIVASNFFDGAAWIFDFSDSSASQILEPREFTQEQQGSTFVSGLDAEGNRFLQIHIRTNQLDWVDIETGNITTIANESLGRGPLMNGIGKAFLDLDKQRIILSASAGIMLVDLNSGDRAFVTH